MSLRSELEKSPHPKGEKTILTGSSIVQQSSEFGIADLQKSCPSIGFDLIQKVLKYLQGQRVECLGRGQSARWRKLN